MYVYLGRHPFFPATFRLEVSWLCLLGAGPSIRYIAHYSTFPQKIFLSKISRNNKIIEKNIYIIATSIPVLHFLDSHYLNKLSIIKTQYHFLTDPRPYLNTKSDWVLTYLAPLWWLEVLGVKFWYDVPKCEKSVFLNVREQCICM